MSYYVYNMRTDPVKVPLVSADCVLVLSWYLAILRRIWRGKWGRVEIVLKFRKVRQGVGRWSGIGSNVITQLNTIF